MEPWCLQDEEHNDVLRWNFTNAWICKWEGADNECHQQRRGHRGS